MAQAPIGAWVYPSATGNLLYKSDERGQRISDFSQCGYRGGTEALPNVSSLIPQSRWIQVNPGTGDATVMIQNAINSVAALTPDANGWRGVVFLNAGEYQLANPINILASGVILKGAGNSTTTGTRLRATGTAQYTLVQVSGTSYRTTVTGTTHNLVQTLVPAGSRVFQVEATTGLAVGQTVIVQRPSPANWITDIGMDLLAVPWTAGSRDLIFDRVITRIDGNWITVDAPLPQTFESKYGGGQIYGYTWPERISQVGIEDIYGFSDFISSTDESHGWKFIDMKRVQNGWVRNITAQYFGYSAVAVGYGGKWLTIADSQCIDPVSVITGGRRYAFNNEGAELALFLNDFSQKGRHDFVVEAQVPGPNAFVQCVADTAYAESGPHQRWSVGTLFDNIKASYELDIQNRGNAGTGHGWAGAYSVVWNSTAASAFRVRNPPTARNWLVGSRGTILASGAPVGADPDGTYDNSGPSGVPVQVSSLYYGQLQQRLTSPGSEFREVWLGEVDQHTGPAQAVNCNPTWLAQVQALGATHSNFDDLTTQGNVAFTFDYTLDPGDIVVAASLTISLRATGTGADTDTLRLDSTASPTSYATLGWLPISTTAPTVCTVEVSPALLTDGRLNVALGTHSAVDFATLHLQVRKSPPPTYVITLNPVADAYVRGGIYANTNFGTAVSLLTKDITTSDVHRKSIIRWDLSGITGKIVGAQVRLAGTAASQLGNESQASLVADDTWSETAVTFNTMPAAGKLFAQWLPVTGQPVVFSVTPQVVDTLLGNGKLSLLISSTGDYGASGNVTYASRENATVANRPQLILTLENSAPVISAITDLTTYEDTATAPIPFVISDAESAATALTVTVASSNTALVPNSNIVVSGSAGNRTATISPALNQSGTTTITLTVSDGSLTSSSVFLLTVIPVNDPPVASSLSTQASQSLDINLLALASDIETPPSKLRFTVTGVASLLADGHTARFTPAAGFEGVANFNYTVTDTWVDPRTFLHYDFQTTGSANDVSGNGRDATIVVSGTGGGASFVLDPPATLAPQHTQNLFLTKNATLGAARLERTIAAADLDLLAANWTMAGWFKRNSNTGIDSVLQLGQSAGLASNAMSLVLPAGSNTLELRNYGASTADVTLVATGINPGVWYHFAIVRNGTTLQLFVNGTVAGSDSSFTFTFDPTRPLKLGGVNTSTSVYDRWFGGGLADFALFSGALTTPEIARLANAPAANFGGLTAGNTVTISVPGSITSWRQNRFQTTANTGIAADSADPDGDGVNNQSEYVLGGNPTLADGLSPLSFTGSQLVFVAKQAAGPGYYGLTRLYTLQSSTDLTAWQVVSGAANIVGANQTVAVPLPSGIPKRFYRLQVTLN